MTRASVFGKAFDAHVRKVGGWPNEAIPFAVEVVGGGKDPMVLVTGAVPIGTRKDGSPKYGLRATHIKAGILLSKYRKLLAMRDAA